MVASDFLQQRSEVARRASVVLTQCAFSASLAAIRKVVASLRVPCSRAASNCALSAFATAVPWASLMEERAIEAFCSVLDVDQEALCRLFESAHGKFDAAYAAATASLQDVNPLAAVHVAVAVATWRAFVFMHTATCFLIVSEVFGLLDLLGPRVLRVDNMGDLCDAVTLRTKSEPDGDLCYMLESRFLFSSLVGSAKEELDEAKVARFRDRLLFVAASYVGVPLLYSHTDPTAARDILSVANDLLERKSWSEQQRVNGVLVFVFWACPSSNLEAAISATESVILESRFAELVPQVKAVAERLGATYVFGPGGSFPRDSATQLLIQGAVNQWTGEGRDKQGAATPVDIRDRVLCCGIKRCYEVAGGD